MCCCSRNDGGVAATTDSFTLVPSLSNRTDNELSELEGTLSIMAIAVTKRLCSLFNTLSFAASLTKLTSITMVIDAFDQAAFIKSFRYPCCDF